MRKIFLLIILILVLSPGINGKVLSTRVDTQVFLDETPGTTDQVGSFSFLPYQFSGESSLSRVILRMGGRVKEFNSNPPDDTNVWAWLPGTVVNPVNPSSIDIIDFEGEGSLDDIAYISRAKEVTIREGDEESKSNILWTYVFGDNVHSIRAADVDADGNVDDLIVAAGTRIFTFKPVEGNVSINSFPVTVDPKIIAPADLNNDGLKDDVVVGTWVENIGVDDEIEIASGNIRAYFSDGSQGWIFPTTPNEKKVTYLTSYDRDSDGNDDDVLVIFSDDLDPADPDSDLYIVSGGSQVFFKSNIAAVAPADFDMDAIMDDFILLSETQISAYDSKTPPNTIETRSKSIFNTTVDKKIPKEFLGVTSISLEIEGGENIFNDVAIFASISDNQRVVFFMEDFGSADVPTTPPPTTAPPTTTPPPILIPTAKITGVSDGTSVLEGSTVSLSASASTDPDGEISSFQWLVDDVLRETSEDFSLNTQGLSSGSHVITLKVTDDDGELGVTSLTISITKANIPPIADAGDNIAVLEGTTVNLSAQASSDPDGEISSYEWTDAGSVFSLEKTVNRNFSLGVHTITLKVTDNMGLSNTATTVVTVVKENLPPKAVAGDDVLVREGISVRFSADASADPDGEIITYTWSMPDGTTVKRSEFNASFPIGVYRIVLNITDDKGAYGTDELTVTVEKSPSVFERIWEGYATEIKIILLTSVGLVSSAVLFFRLRREKGLY